MTDYDKMLALFVELGVVFEQVEGYFSPNGIKTDPTGITKFQGFSITSYDGDGDVTHEFLPDGSYWRTSVGPSFSA